MSPIPYLPTPPIHTLSPYATDTRPISLRHRYERYLPTPPIGTLYGTDTPAISVPRRYETRR
eukprot:2028210-Rhodomonas_salina.1